MWKENKCQWFLNTCRKITIYGCFDHSFLIEAFPSRVWQTSLIGTLVRLCVQNMVHYDYVPMFLHTRMFDTQVQISHNIKASLSSLIVPVAHQYVYRQYYFPLISYHIAVDRIQYVLLIQAFVFSLINNVSCKYGLYINGNRFECNNRDKSIFITWLW
jgi:hypothetical protein